MVYLKWVGEMADEHWSLKSNDAFNAKYFWVVLEHNIKYKAQAFLGDQIKVSTYVERNEGVKSIRVVEFYKEDKLIVTSTTHWCLIDRERNRPTRVPKEVDDMFFED